MAMLERIAGRTPLTVRRAFYVAILEPALYPKTEQGYEQADADLLWLRETDLLTWSAIIDPTRLVRSPGMHEAPEDILTYYMENYRQDPWAELPERIAVTVESDGLAVAIAEYLNHDTPVPVWAVRGNSSATTLHRLSEWLAEARTEAVVLHIGDADGQGCDIERDLRYRLQLFAEMKAAVQPDVERIWLTAEQAAGHRLPGRPSKLTPLDLKYGYDTVVFEAEAGEPAFIANLVRNRLGELLDPAVMADVAEQETTARALFARLRDEVA